MDKELFFKELGINGYKRLFKPFKTNNNYYIYDAGTGKVLQCSLEEYNFWENLWNENSYNYIKNILQISPTILECITNDIVKYNLLQIPSIDDFECEVSRVCKRAKQDLEQITLELTQACNLSCKYCIYQDSNEDFRNFASKKMTWNIAKKAIDYAIEHSSKEVAITFYGGEPLLEFELIKKCVFYAERFDNKEISYSMTTNLTLINNEIAEYLANIQSFSILCSLDGPQIVHDENRLFKNGAGSFMDAIRGLKILVRAFDKSSKDRISLSIVITPPVTDKKLNIIQTFFDELDWLPKEVIKNISYEKFSSRKEKRKYSDSNINKYVDPINKWNLNIFKDRNFTEQFFLSKLRRIHKRLIMEKPVKKFHMNGCCMPASRRLYITTEGNFLLCERIGNAPIIGNVFEGLDYNMLIDKYVHEYKEESLPNCSKCWAVHLCVICYLECFNESGIEIEKKRVACERSKLLLEEELKTYYTILEDRPYLIQKMNIEIDSKY